MQLNRTKRTAVLLTALGILTACGAERAMQPTASSPAAIAPAGPFTAQGTPLCVGSAPPNITQGTNTGTYVVYNSGPTRLSAPTWNASGLGGCNWSYVSGSHCFYAGGDALLERCFSFPHPGGVGVIPVFIYSMPVDANYRGNVRQKAAARQRLNNRTRADAMGVRG